MPLCADRSKQVLSLALLLFFKIQLKISSSHRLR